MKKRLTNVIKWFLMVLGGLFLIQLILFFGAVLGITSFANADLNFSDSSKKLKQFEPIIKYVEEYKANNGKYPEKLENIKFKKNLEYSYKTNEEANCYTITIKAKKDNLKKEYQYCSTDNENSSSKSESYFEYSE